MASPSGISFKGIGLIAAGLLALIFIAIIVVSMLIAPPAAPTRGSDLFSENPDDFIDIEDTQSGGAMLVTMVDQNDPTRIASTLRADRFEPMGEGRRRLDQPESWIYLKDGRALRVNADFATMLMPDPNQPPESGTLEGNILLRAYDSIPAPGTPAPDDQQPTLTARFEEPVEFERRYLRLSSPGRFEIESAQVDFAGTDLTVILNDLRNRIEMIDVAQGDTLVIHTDAVNDRSPQETSTNERSASAKPKPATPETTEITDTETETTTTTTRVAQDKPRTTTPKSTPPATPPAAPDTQRYIVSLDRDVSASVPGSGTVNADTLELWAAFIDGQLPDDAIRRIAIAQNEPRASQQTQAKNTPPNTPKETRPPASANSPSKQMPEPTATAAAEGNDLVINWSGPMRVRPIDAEIPRQLHNDHLALRLSSDEGSGITMSAPDRGFTGQAKELTYFATRAVVRMVGEQTETGIVKMEVEEGGTLYAGALNIDLITGELDMPQRGSITTIHEDPEQIAAVRWTNKAQIAFALNEQGAITQRLRHARFEGAAIAEQAGNSVGARVIHATLDPKLPPASALTTLTLTEGVIASADKQTLTGRDLTIDFVPDEIPGNPPHPVRITSIGSSMGRTPDAMLRANELHAELFRDESGQTRLRTARAVGEVNYRDSNRTTAKASDLDANALEEIIVLTGPDSSVTQAGSTIAGEHITLRAKRRSVEVMGPGTFDHDIALAQDAGARPGQLGHISTRWSESMKFDDTLGSIECVGGVRMISTPDALTRDTLNADRVTINLTPMPSSDPIGGGRDRQRELLNARASGRAEPGKAPQPASIESRSYAADDPELATGVLYLEGAQILADNQRQTLSVPGEGTLLLLDREQDPNQPESDRSLDGSGLTRFTWKSRMMLDRADAQGTFNGGVKVDHKSLTSNEVATLTTDTLVARFEPERSGTDQSTISTGMTLHSATATGDVRFLFNNGELLCDEAIYDAIADSLFAQSLGDTLVTYYDNTQPAPFSARTMRWDLSKDGRDRIEFNAPSPIRTTPGG
ncbi:MAG: hypothetical protein ACF8K1_06435 [Phycisphaerales bacterium JB047]